ncbi:hypothetical protein BD289DRAFT_439045 [Coniella lustricola]|uniref:Uncharacterized protein n=1 Tax=Coniella lustricola TaxID=2025994 RepID=A0A2T3A235_9PEZI|nr:hypothetical protein BD289DRAFT_439045 [Coniella lustricola]
MLGHGHESADLGKKKKERKKRARSTSTLETLTVKAPHMDARPPPPFSLCPLVWRPQRHGQVPRSVGNVLLLAVPSCKTMNSSWEGLCSCFVGGYSSLSAGTSGCWLETVPSGPQLASACVYNVPYCLGATIVLSTAMVSLDSHARGSAQKLSTSWPWSFSQGASVSQHKQGQMRLDMLPRQNSTKSPQKAYSSIPSTISI